MTYQLKKIDGSVEEVQAERWGWGVVYKDDTELKQFNEDGSFHQFLEIQWDNVKFFTMYKLEDFSKRIDIPMSPEIQIFHFYKNLVLENSSRKIRVYVFGWKDKNSGSMVYNFILPDDRIVTASSNIPNLIDYGI